MKRHVRGSILTGQIITLVSAVYLALSFFLLSYLANYSGYPDLAINYVGFGLICVVEIPMAIVGIVQAVSPIGKFRLWAGILSTLFDIILFFLELIGLFSPTIPANAVGVGVAFLVVLVIAVITLISGMVNTRDEKNIVPIDYATLSRPAYMNGGNYVPTPVTPSMQTPVDPGLSPEASQVAADLEALKKLFEQQLITEEEYKNKKRDILDRAFFK